MPATKELKSKIVLVGDKAVGKSSLIRRYVLDQFGDEYLLTLGAKVMKKAVRIPFLFQDLVVTVEFSIWDIMGQTRFRDLLKEAYLSGASGAVAVMDVTRRDTLEGIGDWIAAVREVAGAVPVVLAANKKDLLPRAAVQEADVARCAEELGSEYLLTSAKTGENVEEAFLRLGTAVAVRQLGL